MQLGQAKRVRPEGQRYARSLWASWGNWEQGLSFPVIPACPHADAELTTGSGGFSGDDNRLAEILRLYCFDAPGFALPWASVAASLPECREAASVCGGLATVRMRRLSRFMEVAASAALVPAHGHYLISVCWVVPKGSIPDPARLCGFCSSFQRE